MLTRSARFRSAWSAISAIGGPFKLGLGALYAMNFVPNALER